MGTGNTIKTGGSRKSSHSRSSTTANSYYNRDQNPYTYGKVTQVIQESNGGISIIYTPLKDRVSSSGNEKQGKAFPFYANMAKVPEVNNIVPLLKGPNRVPLSDVGDVAHQYDSATYFLDPMDIQGTANNNTVGSSSTGTENTDTGTGNNNSPSNSNIGAMLPPKGNENAQNNRIFVKNYLKSKGLTKEQAAGIMGNAETECHFVVTLPPNQDTKGKSFGLIQWNSLSYPDAYTRLMPSTSDPRSAIEKQCEALFNGYTPDVKTYLKRAVNPLGDDIVKKYALPSKTLDADIAAFLFARIVERCSFCTSTKSVYDAGGKTPYRGKLTTIHTSTRSKYALGFMQKFNDPKDPLYWG